MNPMQLISSIVSNQNAMNNPMISNAYKLMQKNDVDGLKQMATNLCKEKGLDINRIEKQIQNNFKM